MEEKLIDNISNIVKKVFTSEIQSKRVIKEIQLLRELDQKLYKVALQKCALGLKIMIDVTEQCLKKYSQELNLAQKPITFEILLEEKFPFIHPRVFCRTSFTQPSIADGRDILADILKTIWGPQVLLHQIVQKIPPFLLEIQKMQEQIQLQSIGKFHLGFDYNLEDFLAMDSVNVFPAKEILDKSVSLRYIIISSVNVLNFEISDQKRNLIKLIQYSILQNLQNIKRKKDNNKLIILQWKDPDDTKQTLPQQTFQFDDSQQIIDLIIKYMKQNGVKIIKNAIKKPDLTMDDVTGKKDFEGLNIMLLMENISILESQIAVDINVSNINTLMTLYQKAIEYFSALNDETYINYINRLQELLQKPEVQSILETKSKPIIEEKKQQEQEYQEQQQADQDFEISNNLEEEEEKKKEIKEKNQEQQKKEEHQNQKEQIQQNQEKLEEIKQENQKQEEQQQEEIKQEQQKQEIKQKKEKEEIKQEQQKEEIILEQQKEEIQQNEKEQQEEINLQNSDKQIAEYEQDKQQSKENQDKFIEQNE